MPELTDTQALDRIAALARSYGDCGSDFIGDVCNIVNETGRSTEAEEEHVFLVGFVVRAQSREAAEANLGAILNRGRDYFSDIESSWWVAEDDRHDGSDNDSAVFVTPGMQAKASDHLARWGYTPQHNVVARPSRFED